MPGAAPGGMGWTLNPYRGCSHACTYCFARDSHHHLGHNTGDSVLPAAAGGAVRVSVRR